MISNRRRDTRPEVEVRKALHRRGRRFRVDYRVDTASRPVRVDIAFPRQRVAVFVDGCFWHGCPLHRTTPKRNRDYWEPKLAENEARDRRQTRLLREIGWAPLRFWAHMSPDDIADTVDRVLRNRAIAAGEVDYDPFP